MLAEEAQVLDACNRLVDFAVWPRGKVHYRAWLDNFDAADRPLAVNMLGRFTFLSHQLVDHHFVAAFQAISNHLPTIGGSFAARRERWARFCDEAIIVPVMGEQPSPADSGWGFARKARQLLGIDEGRLMHPHEAVASIAGGSTAPVVFVDDFVGSGDQFLSTWEFRHPQVGGASFADMSGRFPAFYCNVMMTAYGRHRIRGKVPEVILVSGNVIPRDHNYLVPGSAMWPNGGALAAARLARRIGAELGFVATDGGDNDWRGYHRLGLGIAMEDSVPDANLPIFFGETNGWQPLVRRS
jgi:hypothetical protein